MLAVDRNAFAQLVTEKIKSHPLISVISEEITELPSADFGSVIIASGPLTSKPLAESILSRISNNALSFYDAIAPVVFKESINFDAAWFQSRYDKGDKFDYINCPLSKEQYYAFVDALLAAEKVDFHDWEKPNYFDGCLPIEVMAERGRDTLLYGPMKPVGLTNPHSTEKPFAVVQLRQDNKEDTLRNIVGFQTKLKYGEQKRIFQMIPGLDFLMLDSQCCGIAGTYGFKKENYETSQGIGAPLFKQIEEAKVDFVATDCETCKWQIEMSTSVPVMNPVSILAEALDVEATIKANQG